MSKAEEIAKQYASELIESGAIKDYQRSWMESVYIHIYNSRQSEIDELQKEWFKRGYESIQDEVERLKDDYKEVRKIADVQEKHIDVQDKLIYDQTSEIDELTKEVERLRKEREWISIEASLPNYYDLCLLMNNESKDQEDNWVVAGYYNHQEEKFYNQFQDKNNDCEIFPTHWQPLPPINQ